MTPELAPLEPFFRWWSVAHRIVWPPDPFLRAKARAFFAARRAEILFAECLARASVLELLHEELRERLAAVDDWTAVATAYAELADRERLRSPAWKDT